MQYMHFRSSCAYCCVANLLEMQGGDMTDLQLFRAMQAEWLLHYDQESCTWQTGAMLQRGVWFDLALRPLGFTMKETRGLSPEEVTEEEPPFMVGLKTGRGGRHAHVLVRREGDALTFLNPHGEGDGEPDFVTMTKREAVERLAAASAVGRLSACEPGVMNLVPFLKQAQENWTRYREELLGFIAQIHSPEEIRGARDSLFRAFLLDGLEGARICGHKAQEARLEKLQGQFLRALRKEDALCLSEYLDQKVLTEAIAFFQNGVKHELAVTGKFS